MASTPPDSPSELDQQDHQDDKNSLRVVGGGRGLWNSWGFIEVGEGKREDGDYPLKRTKSSMFSEHTEDAMTAGYYKQLENRILLLQREVVTLKTKVDVFEEDVLKPSTMLVKYSRRLSLVSNILLGLWVFWSHFTERIKQKKSKLLQNMMNSHAQGDTVNTIIYEAYIQAIAKSWFFFVAAICIASVTAWKTKVGLGISTIASVYPIFKNQSAWAHYLSLASTILYSFAEWGSRETKEANVKTLGDFIGPFVEKTNGHSGHNSNVGTRPSTPRGSRRSSIISASHSQQLSELASYNGDHHG